MNKQQTHAPCELVESRAIAIQNARASRFRRRRRQRGAATTEYVVLLSACAIGIAVATVALGPPLVRSFSFTRALLVSPVP